MIRLVRRMWNRRQRAIQAAADQARYDALVAQMANTWRIVNKSMTPCYFDVKDKGSFIGHITIVAETNELNHRRVRCLECPPFFRQEQNPNYSAWLIWAAEAEPTMPARTPINVRELI